MMEEIKIFLGIVCLIIGIFFSLFFYYRQGNKTSQEELLWEYQKERARRESEAEKNKEWFSESRWLSDKEIDWAVERMEKDEKFKILPAYQFHLAKESKRADDKLIFSELLNQINDSSKELVFIPVNNPDFHWSLLVYENNSQTFYHYDTFRGVNWDYVESLAKELLQQIHKKKVNFNEYLIKQHDIDQGNGSDCGVAVIAIIERIIELKIQTRNSWLEWMRYGKFNLGDDLGEFDFGKERKSLREEYLKESGGN